MPIELAIVDQDQDFLHLLENYWKDKGIFSFSFFSKLEDFMTDPRRNRVKLVILDAQAASSLQDKDPSYPGLWLPWAEEAQEGGGIFKYQSMEDFKKEIFFLLSSKEEISQKEEAKGSFLILVADQEAASLGREVARLLAMRSLEKTVFFLDLDPLAEDGPSGQGNFSGQAFGPRGDQQKYTFSDLILSLRLPHGDPKLRLEACQQKREGYFTLLACDQPSDYLDIRPQEWKRLAALFRQAYDSIILTMTPGFLVLWQAIFAAGDSYAFLGGKREEIWRGLFPFLSDKKMRSFPKHAPAQLAKELSTWFA